MVCRHTPAFTPPPFIAPRLSASAAAAAVAAAAAAPATTALVRRPSRLRSGRRTATAAPPLCMSTHEHKPKVIVIAGPTGVGKSALAMRLARAIGGQIISADSVQVYRHLDIGANKPSHADIREIPHHMLDVCDPAETDFNAGDYFSMARAVTQAVSRDGALPVVVGGTMMYLRWYIFGKPATPEADPAIARQVRREIEELDGDWERGIALLAAVDQQRASKLFRNDWYRLGRALEVARTAGVGMTGIPVTGGAPGSHVGLNTSSGALLDFDFRCFFLSAPRQDVYRLIDARCEAMILDKGLLDEVADLLAKHRLRPDSSAARAIGYRQTVEYFAKIQALDAAGEDNDGDVLSDDELSLWRDFLNGFMSASRQYARQQIKWFRSEPLFHFVPSANTSSGCHIGGSGGSDNVSGDSGSGGSEDPLDTVMRIVEMSGAEYTTFVQSRTDAPLRAQTYAEGKRLKEYISARARLSAGSAAEAATARHARQLARALGPTLDAFRAPPAER